MIYRRSLRFRICLAFGVLGILLGALFGTASWRTSEKMEAIFIEDTLREELRYFMAQRLANPATAAPATTSIRGYVVPLGGEGAVPMEVRDLPPGQHEVSWDGRDYEVAVADAEGLRFFLTYDESRIQATERTFVIIMIATTLGGFLVSVVLGWLTADYVAAPVRSLARQVRDLGRDGPSAFEVQEKTETVFSEAFRGHDEVRALAEAFDSTLGRLRRFLAREREFTADASHQLRTSVSVISSTAELLLAQKDLPESCRERLEPMARTTAHLMRQIEAFLLLSREPRPEKEMPTSVPEALRRLASPGGAFSLQGEGRLQLIESPCSPPESFLVNAPRAALDTVVGNLVENALSHSSGPVHLRIGTGEVTVEDQGPGIPEGLLEDVFQRGFRGPTEAAGTGLGLAIVRRVCERFGWSVELQSHNGSGTIARVRFSPASVEAPLRSEFSHRGHEATS